MLSSLPIYMMSLFCMWQVISIRLKKIWEDFFYSGGAPWHEPHLISWKSIMGKRKEI